MLNDNGALGLSWVLDRRLAAFPVWALNDLGALQRERIGAIVSLTESFPEQLIGETCFETLHLPIVDMTAPATTQIRQFVEFVDDALARGLAVGVHCLAGLGRTGTMVACYLVSQGDSPEDAIRKVRQARPGSVQTEGQEAAVQRWAMVRSGRWQSAEFL